MIVHVVTKMSDSDLNLVILHKAASVMFILKILNVIAYIVSPHRYFLCFL